MTPRRLSPVFHDKVWGARHLEPWFRDRAGLTGEVWFEASEPLPLLVKFLFTSDRLSVQVHPGDEYARRYENSAGKTEMWHILRAEPGAAVAAGFARPLTSEQLRRAVQSSGALRDLLRWHPVKAGDTIFVPAGTVHAIGPGIALCEIQQYSDVTYRLYDWDRQPARELHVDKALAVADPGTHPGPLAAAAGELVRCQHFVTELHEWRQAFEYEPANCFHLLVVLEGSGTIAGSRFAAGEVWLAPRGCAPFAVVPQTPVKLLRTYVPEVSSS